MQLDILLSDASLTHIALSGRLDLKGVGQIRDQFVFNTTTRSVPALVDLSGVSFIASLGMGMLVEAAKALKNKGVSLVLLRPSQMVREALEMAGIHNVVSIAGDDTEARTMLAGE